MVGSPGWRGRGMSFVSASAIAGMARQVYTDIGPLLASTLRPVIANTRGPTWYPPPWTDSPTLLIQHDSILQLAAISPAFPVVLTLYNVQLSFELALRPY